MSDKTAKQTPKAKRYFPRQITAIKHLQVPIYRKHSKIEPDKSLSPFVVKAMLSGISLFNMAEIQWWCFRFQKSLLVFMTVAIHLLDCVFYIFSLWKQWVGIAGEQESITRAAC